MAPDASAVAGVEERRGEGESARDGRDPETVRALYQQRLARYTAAMRHEMTDRVPIRPFVAEFTGRYAGFTCQELAHDYRKAFNAACRCAADFEWDAVVANMVYVWTGLAQSIGLKYYGIPGIDIPAETGFQYREPPLDDAFMRADEYDALIDSPTEYLYRVWLPRVSRTTVKIGAPCTYENNVALVKTAMAMMQYFGDFGPQIERLQTECGTVSAIAGILKAPLDILADKLRGYLGLVEDLFERREKVVAACVAMAPHLTHIARTTADPARQVPIGLWMHRGGVPFVSPEVFDNIYWATLKPVIQELWAAGHQTLFYAEGNWDYHLDRFAELPEQSIVYHVDQGDVFKARDVLGDRFCISGGLSNVLLGFGTPAEVRARCREIVEGFAQSGGYIMDAGAIVQNDAQVENVRAMTEATLEYGVYSRGHAPALPTAGGPRPRPEDARPGRYLPPLPGNKLQPGECISWQHKKAEIGDMPGDEDLARRVWQEIDSLGNGFIWQLLLSF